MNNPEINENINKYWSMANDLKIKILKIPDSIATTNNKVDFSFGRYQEIMIDTEGYIETLENDFYLYSEEV